MPDTLNTNELIAEIEKLKEEVNFLKGELQRKDKFSKLLTLAIIHHYNPTTNGEMDKDNVIKLSTLQEQ